MIPTKQPTNQTNDNALALFRYIAYPDENIFGDKLFGMKAYSSDLRQRIVACVHAGANDKQAAQRFGVSAPTVARYVQRFAQTDSVERSFAPGAKPRITPAVWQAWQKRIDETPNATVAEHQRWLKEEHGVVLCHSAVHDNLVRRGYTHKKRP